jgi:hypothetical protein
MVVWRGRLAAKTSSQTVKDQGARGQSCSIASAQTPRGVTRIDQSQRGPPEPSPTTKSLKKPLYVAFADLSNAFPSTDLPTLWLKLREMGIGGKVFDWLRMLYARMSYYVNHNGQRSSDFKSDIGVLIGDTCSPVLWILYMADLMIRTSPRDVTLRGIPIAHLEQADDIILMATTAEDLQDKMNDLQRWCADNFMVLNAVKSFVVVFNQTPAARAADQGRQFHFANAPVETTVESTYVGILYAATERNIFKNHYGKKADKAEKISRMVFALENVMGPIPPLEGIKLYTALVEPHLLHGCEISVDTTRGLLERLQKVQNTFLRRLLGLWERSIRCILHTETGLAPVEYRRLEVALGNLQYLINLPEEHLARVALEEAMAMDREGAKSWVTDLKTALLALKIRDLRVPALHSTPTDELVKNLRKCLRRSMEEELQSEVDRISKLYLIHDRLEPMEENRPPRKVTIMYRHYWAIHNTKHRKALAGLILSNHPLAVERLRWRNVRPPREERKCRLCGIAVETPEHALLECTHDETTAKRIEWLKETNDACPDVVLHLVREAPKGLVAQLKLLIADRTTINILAKYAAEILDIYDKYPMVLSDEFEGDA